MTQQCDDGTTVPTEETRRVARETLLGDLMLVVVDELKAARDVWQRLSQDEQDEAIERLKRRLTETVRECVRIISSGDRPTIPAQVVQVVFKDGIKATLALSKGNSRRHDLADSVGAQVLVVVPDHVDYEGGTDQVKSEPDQRNLDLDGDGKPDDEAKAAKPKRNRKAKDAAAAAAPAAAEPQPELPPVAPLLTTPPLAPSGPTRPFAVAEVADPEAVFGVWAHDEADAWRLFQDRVTGVGERDQYVVTPADRSHLAIIGCINPMDAPTPDEYEGAGHVGAGEG